VQSVAINPLGDVAASGAEGGTIILWDVVAGRPLRQLSGHSNTVGTLAFSPDGALLVSGGADTNLSCGT
jgi:FOG: WD40 repeat